VTRTGAYFLSHSLFRELILCARVSPNRKKSSKIISIFVETLRKGSRSGRHEYSARSAQEKRILTDSLSTCAEITFVRFTVFSRLAVRHLLLRIESDKISSFNAFNGKIHSLTSLLRRFYGADGRSRAP